MEMSSAASSAPPMIEIEAVQTVTPLSMTDPRETRQVSIPEPVTGPEIFRACFNVVLYYNKAMEEESGWLVAGWIKESLARVLRAQPMLSGRLRRGGEDGNGELEVVANDSGARLIEAKITVTMQEFLEMKEREKLEAELAFWKEVDEQNPQYSPLFYVQVTNFQCGGYSVGMSCSLLLADLLIVENFIQKWANIQKELLPKTETKKVPIFYFPKLKPINLTPIISPNQSKHCGQTMIFNFASKDLDLKDDDSSKSLALFCIEEAEGKIGSKVSSNYTLVVKESLEVLRVQNGKKHEVVKTHLDMKSMATCLSWDELGIREVAFHEGNKPVHASHWIGPTSDGVVMAMPFSHGEDAHKVNVLVTIPFEKV